jgi:hypothetical protein
VRSYDSLPLCVMHDIKLTYPSRYVLSRSETSDEFVFKYRTDMVRTNLDAWYSNPFLTVLIISVGTF